MDACSASEQSVLILINSHSGTVRSMGAEGVMNLVRDSIRDWPSSIEVKLLAGPEIVPEVRRAIAGGQVTAIVVGGGDGTVASVAGEIRKTHIALGVLPLGTMNLIARTLGVSAVLPEALRQLTLAQRRAIDAGRVGDKIFLHHLSLGIQPRMVKIREKLGYSSRLTKIIAGSRAMLSVLFKPQSMRLHTVVDGRHKDVKAPAYLVSNNLYDNSMWLRPKSLDGGTLGIYCVRPMSTLATMGLALDLLRGRWRSNLNVDEDAAKHVRIEKRRRFGRFSRSIAATMDGELVLLSSPVEVFIEPLALQVLVPPGTHPEMAELQTQADVVRR